MRARAGLLLLAALSGCEAEETGSVVFGATTEIKPSTFERVTARVMVAGKERSSEDFSGGEIAFPLELRVDDVEDQAEVELTLDVYAAGSLLLTRKAATRAIADRVLLYPMTLDVECVGASVPVCAADQTCVDGACASPFADPSTLTDYYPGWAGGNGGDRCEPGGPPEVAVGQGQASYLPLTEGEVAQVEAGPQGGYHIWLAVRAKNLKQSGTITEVVGRVDELGYDVPAFSVVFTMDPDEGGYCKLAGLRFRLDDETHPIETLLGKQLGLTVVMTDSDGDVGTGTKTVTLSPDVI